MPCPHCGRAEGAPTPPCPRCPQVPGASHSPEATDAAVLVPTGEDARNTQDAAIDPEVLPPEGQSQTTGTPYDRAFDGQQLFGQGQSQGGGQHAQGSFRFTMWHGTGGAGGTGMGGGALGFGQASCLPGIITLFLTLVCAVQFGVLAALGFLVFNLLGSGLVLALNLQQVMQGRPANWGMGPWLGRVVVWCASWALAGWLSGGF